MEHLALEIFDLATTENPKPVGSKFTNLQENASITIIDTSDIFASGDVWSYSFTLNVYANAHIFGTAGDIHGARLHEQIDKRRARLWVEGLPLFLGYLKLSDEVEVDKDGNVDVTLESGQHTFDDMIDGMNARDVSVGDDVMIGVALNRKRSVRIPSFRLRYQLDANASFPDKSYYQNFLSVGATEVHITQRWPKLVLSKGVLTDLADNEPVTINTVNVQTAYDDSHPYCNINICYQRKKKKTIDINDTEEVTTREYVLRLASGQDTTNGGDNEVRFNNSPNFFLLYWLDRLFRDKGVSVVENQALDVEDLRRVFLANIGCFYEEKDTDIDNLENYEEGTKDYKRYGKFSFPGNFCYEPAKVYPYDDDRGSVLMRNGRLEITLVNGEKAETTFPQTAGVITSLTDSSSTAPWSVLAVTAGDMTGYRAYATSDNYPDANVSDVIDAMKAAFGVRFLFDRSYNKVRVVLLRNIFRSKDVQKVSCEVVSRIKEDNGIRGFRMTYNGGEDDTNYNYHDWQYATTDVGYEELRKNYVTSFNKNCYINAVTGNAYRIKIDEDEAVFFPALFEVGGYNDAEDGDCSGEEGSIHTVTVGALPLIMNEVNGKYAFFFSGETKAPGNKNEITAQIPVSSTPYRNEYSDAFGNKWLVTGDLDIYIKEGYSTVLQDNYNLSGIIDNPFDDAKIGLCFGIMRGSGSDAYIKYDDDPDDGEDNQTWDVIPGSGAVSHPDTCDDNGNEWDYNGEGTDIGSREGRFSLKLRAEKPNPYYYDTKLPNVITKKTDAGEAMQEFYKTANTDLLARVMVANATMRAAGWDVSGDGYTTVCGMIDEVVVLDGKSHAVLWTPIREDGTVLTQAELETYIDGFNGMTVMDMVSHDTQHLILDIDTTEQRAVILEKLQAIYYATEDTDASVDISYLKGSRTETRTETYQSNVVETKEEAAQIVKETFGLRGQELLNMPGYFPAIAHPMSLYIPGFYALVATPFDMTTEDINNYFLELYCDVYYPFATDLEPYRKEFQKSANKYIDVLLNEDRGRRRIIVEIPSTIERAKLLDGLLKLYYARSLQPVTLPTGIYITRTRDVTYTIDASSETTSVEKETLRGRGLADQFYKEYSLWIRKSRIVRMTVHITLAQLLAIDKAKRVTIGDITGFIRKMQYTVSNKTGLGDVTMEIMYI